MRPIEFRAWDKKAKVMVYPVVVYETQDHVGFSAQTFKRCYDQNEWYEHLEVGDDWYYLFDDKVMQYTGLKDANGQKIFEGDIFKIHLGADNWEYKEVYYNSGCFWLNCLESELLCNHYPHLDLKVIGNIYQNKELLNEVKNDSAD